MLGTILKQDLAHLHESTEHTRRSAKRQIQTLEGQRKKLLAAYYTNSVPLDLFREEQARLTNEIHRTEARLEAAEISYGQITQTLDTCLRFAASCDQTYREAPEPLRRQLNQAIFKKFFVDEDGIVTADLAEPFDRLLGPNLLEEKEQTEETKIVELMTADQDQPKAHHNHEWADGVPAWLRNSQWWEQAKDRPYGHAVTGQKDRRTRSRRVVSLCLGSKENDLAEGQGFEPWVLAHNGFQELPPVSAPYARVASRLINVHVVSVWPARIRAFGGRFHAKVHATDRRRGRLGMNDRRAHRISARTNPSLVESSSRSPLPASRVPVDDA